MLKISFLLMGITGLVAALAAGCDGGNGETGGGHTGGGGSGGSGGGGASSSSVSSSSGGPDTGGGGSVSASDVTGTVKSTWLTDTGELADVPESEATIAALVPKAGGGFDEIPGEYDPSKGTFVIHGVPEVPYYLRSGTGFFLATSARTLDLGTVRGGRPDAAPITQSPTSLVLDVNGLAPWQDTDYLELFSLGANAWGDIEYLGPVFVGPGDTSLTGFSIDASQLILPALIDAGKGDRTLLTQLTTRTAGSVPYVAVAKAADLGSVTLKDGLSASANGALQDVPQKAITVDWKRSQFAALLADVGPGVSNDGHAINIYDEPGGAGRVSTAAPPDLLSLNDLDDADVTLDLAYGNPFPASHGAIADVLVAYSIALNVSGPTKRIRGALLVEGSADTLFQGPVVPLVSPPTSVTIGGKPATSDLAGVGASPVLAWGAPKVGTAAFYTVRIYQFDASGRHAVARFFTTDTTVTVPPGVLQAGGQYAAQIAASTMPLDLAAPFRQKPGGGTASALTAVFTP